MKKVLLLLLILLVAVGGYVAFTKLQKQNDIATKLRQSPDQEERMLLAKQIYDQNNWTAFETVLKSDSPEACMALIETANQTPLHNSHDEQKFLAASQLVFANLENLDPLSLDSAMILLLQSSKIATADAKSKVQGLFNSSHADLKIAACKIAVLPEFELQSSVVNLLKDQNPNIRQAAIIALAAPEAGAKYLSEEELFPFLSDVSESVCLSAQKALQQRGLNAQQISLGRRFAHQNAQERIKLLDELMESEIVKDLSPWLMRLSKDADPAIRAGVARVAFESRTTGQWLDDLADRDNDLLVRQIASYYRRIVQKSSDIAPAQFLQQPNNR